MNLRNGIVHKTGNLPDGIDPESVRTGVMAVLSLAGLLAGAREVEIIVPKLDKIWQKSGLYARGEIQQVGRHEYLIKVDFYYAQVFPSAEIRHSSLYENPLPEWRERDRAIGAGLPH